MTPPPTPSFDERGGNILYAPDGGAGANAPAGTRLRQLNGDGTVTQWWKTSELDGDVHAWVKAVGVPFQPARIDHVSTGTTFTVPVEAYDQTCICHGANADVQLPPVLGAKGRKITVRLATNSATSTVTTYAADSGRAIEDQKGQQEDFAANRTYAWVELVSGKNMAQSAVTWQSDGASWYVVDVAMAVYAAA